MDFLRKYLPAISNGEVCIIVRLALSCFAMQRTHASSGSSGGFLSVSIEVLDSLKSSILNRVSLSSIFLQCE